MPDYYLLFTLACLTGMRSGEYTALTKEDVILTDKPYIQVNKQFYMGEIKETKTVSSTRPVDIGEYVINAYNFHVKKYGIFQGYLFLSPKYKDRPVAHTTLSHKFKKLLELCGYPKNYMRLHDLRGQYVDILHSQNVPTKFISNQVGHSSTRLTNDVYSQILQDTHDYARNAIDEAMRNCKKSAS